MISVQMICSSQTYPVSNSDSNLGSQGWIQTNRTIQIRTDLLIENCRPRETWPWQIEVLEIQYRQIPMVLDAQTWGGTWRATPPVWRALPPRAASAPAASGWREVVRWTTRPSYPCRRPKCCRRARHQSPARIGWRGKRRGTRSKGRKKPRTSPAVLLISRSRN
jgi:hypothetical protein